MGGMLICDNSPSLMLLGGYSPPLPHYPTFLKLQLRLWAFLVTLLYWTCRVHAFITNHLGDFAPYMEKYKTVEIFPM